MSAFTQDCFSHRLLTLTTETVKLSIMMAGEWWRSHEAEVLTGDQHLIQGGECVHW